MKTRGGGPRERGSTVVGGRRLLAVALFAALALASSRPLRAEPRGRLAFRSYTTEDGLASLATYSLLQDRGGRIWVATEDGVFRHNGDRFERVGAQGEGLPATWTVHLRQDGAGAIWAGTVEGLARWNGHRFEEFADTRGLPKNLVKQLEQGPDGRIWANFDRQPFRFTAQEQFERVPGWRFGVCTALARFQRGPRMWAAATSEEGEHAAAQILSFEGEEWSAWPIAPEVANQIVEAVLEDPAGNVWARTRQSLLRLAPGEPSFAVFAPVPPADTECRLSLDDEGQLLVPTNAGLYWLRGERLQFIGQAEGSPTPWVRDAIVDREGTLWIAGMGIHRALGRGLFRTYAATEGLPGTAAWSLFRDSKQRLWVGTNRGLVLAGETSWQPVPGTEGTLVKTIVEASDGAIVATGVPGTVLSWNPEAHTLQKNATLGTLSKNVYRLLFDRDDHLWVATARSGLLSGTLRGGDLTLAPVALPDGTPDEMFLDLSEGRGGRLWAAGQHGLALLEHGLWRRFTQADGLRANHVAIARETPSGEILVAFAASGFSRYRLTDGKLERLEDADLVPGEATPIVYALGQDARGALWIGTGRGIFVRTPGGEEQFTMRDGLPSDDVSMMAYLADPDGAVWFGTAGGLARFDGHRYKGPIAPPEAWIVSASIGPRPLDGSQRLEVPHRDNALYAHFASSSFAGEGKQIFAVKLSGVDPDWQLLRSREARYANLGPADYTFQVRSRVGSGGWGPVASLGFRVRPAFYQTAWFKILLGAAAALAIAAIVRLRLRALERQNRQLEAQVAARTRELAGANSELQAANTNMRLVLDNVDQGLAMVDSGGDLLEERSLAFEAWFGKGPPGEHFAVRLSAGSADSETSLQMSYEQLVEGLLPVDVCLDQMPRLLTRDGRYYGLAFKPVLDGESIRATLLMVSDVTARIEAGRAETAQKEQLKTFERITQDKAGFLEFFDEASALVGKLADGALLHPSEKLRVAHTLKGNAALFEVQSISDAAHHLEQTMLDGDPETVEPALGRIVESWEAYAARVAPLLGGEKTTRVEIERAELDRIVYLARIVKSPEIERALVGLLGEPVGVRLGRIADQLRHLSRRLGKGDPEIVVRAADVRLLARRYAELWVSFAHLVRNAVDHGFQTAEERAAAGKPPRNRVELVAATQGDRLVLEIADDGRGIAWDKLARRAAEQGLPHGTKEELRAALFSDGVSTAEKVSATSGRGVGMSAVKQACDAIGGAVAVHSDPGTGTRFVFTLPLFLPGPDDLPQISVRPAFVSHRAPEQPVSSARPSAQVTRSTDPGALGPQWANADTAPRTLLDLARKLSAE